MNKPYVRPRNYRDRPLSCPTPLQEEPRSEGLNVNPDAVVENRDLVAEELFSRRERGRAESGLLERIQQVGSIVRRGLDEDIEVESGPGNAMEYGGNAPDDDVPNVMGVKAREYALETIQHSTAPTRAVGSGVPGR